MPTDPRLLMVEGYEEFLKLRAVALADAANRYFAEIDAD